MKGYVRDNVGHLVSADGRSLPFKDEQFDAVMSSFLLHHLRDLDNPYEVEESNASVRFLRDVVRVLKVGGTARITQFGRMRDEKESLQKLIAFALSRAHVKSRLESRSARMKDLRTGADLDVQVVLITLTKKR